MQRTTSIKDEAAHTHFQLRTLGDWSLRDADGGLLPRVGRKAFALLVYLSLAPENRAPRDRLADLLWPERESAQARNSLRQTLAVIRSGLSGPGGPILETDRETVALMRGQVRCDAVDLLLLADDPEEASRLAPLYTGAFLDGFYSGSQVFEDWAAGMRDMLGARAVQAFHNHVRGIAPQAGLMLLPRLLSIDPARETSYQLGMELHAALKQRDQALRLYESCKAMLHREYGVSPSPETERIRRRLIEGLPQETRPLPPVGDLSGKTPLVRVTRFANLSADPALGRFLDGLFEATVIELAHMREVIALRDADPGQSQLAADYVLTGSLMEQGGRFELIVRLVDPESGQNLSGERFRGMMEDQIGLLQSISQCIALATRFEVLQAGWKLKDMLPIDDHPVRLLVLRAHARYYELTTASLHDSVRLCDEALRLDPSSLRAQRMMSLALSGSMVQGALPRTPDHVSRAIELGRSVARAVPDDVFTRCVLAWALGNADQHDAAIEELRYAIRLNPLYCTLHSDLAEHYALMGYTSEAIAECAEAIRLSADDVVSFWRYHSIAVAQFAAGNYGAALEAARRVMREKPGLLRAALFRAAAAAALGLREEAEQTVTDILRERPDLRLGALFPDVLPRYVQDAHQNMFTAMLAKAGLPA